MSDVLLRRGVKLICYSFIYALVGDLFIIEQEEKYSEVVATRRAQIADAPTKGKSGEVTNPM